MTDLNKQELRRLAEMASPAYEWYAPCDLRYADDKTGEVHGLNHDDDSFISAANPAAILSLLDECESLHSAMAAPDEIAAEPAGDYETLRKQFMSLLMMANSKCRQVKHWREQSGHVQQQKIWENAANVSAERDTNAMLTDVLEKVEAERDQLRAEVEALRKDAERWRCVRNAVPMQSPYAVWREGSHPVFGRDADELVDNFLKAREGNANG